MKTDFAIDAAFAGIMKLAGDDTGVPDISAIARRRASVATAVSPFSPISKNTPFRVGRTRSSAIAYITDCSIADSFPVSIVISGQSVTDSVVSGNSLPSYSGI